MSDPQTVMQCWKEKRIHAGELLYSRTEREKKTEHASLSYSENLTLTYPCLTWEKLNNKSPRTKWERNFRSIIYMKLKNK